MGWPISGQFFVVKKKKKKKKNIVGLVVVGVD